MDRLDRLREVAVQTTHCGERGNALRAAAREQGSTITFERMICDMEQRARLFDRMAKEHPAMADGLRQLADDQRDLIARSFEACGG